MNQKTLGWIIFIAGLGMMLGLLAGDISNLKEWNEATHPSFIAGVLTHISAVITAGVGGNLVPNLFRDKSNDLSEATLNHIKAMENKQ